jgi:hypothetical protein
MNRFCAQVTLGMLAVAAIWIAPVRADDAAHAREEGANPVGLHDFDFLTGVWRVHHHRLKPNTDEWLDFEGTSRNRRLMDGMANIEEQDLNAPSGAYHAVALRAYDPKVAKWAIWWLDGRYPSGPIGPPVKGSFEHGVGTFYSDDIIDGKPIRTRFIWSHITERSARWEQASSPDAGKTWQTNWVMNFERDSRDTGKANAEGTGAHDFDFLVGDWHVRHRYLRIVGDNREWVEAEGTVSHRKLMDGGANLEVHTIDAPAGAYAALALRSYDAKNAQWSIWWLDGRSPHGDLDPPVQGRFENGIGTFYGDTRVNGAPVRMRFIWSRITAKSARWEQAYSADGGKNWETNWIMEFERSP